MCLQMSKVSELEVFGVVKPLDKSSGMEKLLEKMVACSVDPKRADSLILLDLEYKF